MWCQKSLQAKILLEDITTGKLLVLILKKRNVRYVGKLTVPHLNIANVVSKMKHKERVLKTGKEKRLLTSQD